ncbi:Beta-lactamase hydrolase-like protein [Paenibacillus sp. P1XP2]|nr:Beta-lactamase hydrolase-like protein [Paenibacillus sp. P1XP2]
MDNNPQTLPVNMTPEELGRIITRQEKLFVLDVRNETEFKDWKIEGQALEIINIPYFDLLDSVEPALKRIPEGERLLVVCAKEGSSRFIAERIAEAGRSEVHYLEGGMKRWGELLVPVKAGDLKSGGEIYQFNRLGKGCLSYMIVSDGEAVVVDAARMVQPYIDFARERGIRIQHIVDTHLHADHISGGRELAGRTGASYFLPPQDADEVVFSYLPLTEGRDIRIGHTDIRPMYSPGHTLGSTTLLVDDRYLLTGDILFVASIGRPDLAGKAEDWVGDLRNTLYGLYSGLPEELIVLPAHFGTVAEMDRTGAVSAKLGDLYRQNPGLKLEDEQTFRQTVTEQLPPQPHAYREIRQTNMGKISPDEETQREMETGPNRCAVHD